MMKMEVAKISSKGQITIPVSVRNKLNLKTGDKVVIFEENGRFYFENSAMLAFKRAEQAFEGVAEKAGFQTGRNEKEIEEER
jgi:AbrB family looped-hinge helix DNA binding protein